MHAALSAENGFAPPCVRHARLEAEIVNAVSHLYAQAVASFAALPVKLARAECATPAVGFHSRRFAPDGIEAFGSAYVT